MEAVNGKDVSIPINEKTIIAVKIPGQVKNNQIFYLFFLVDDGNKMF